MQRHMISIIVPVYNAQGFLKRCLNSILTQKYENFELILVNDGSQDRSGEICDEYRLKDSRVRVFHKQNGGVSSARNVGLENAKGEWIAFCDADDFVYSEWLENFNIKENEDYDLIIQGMRLESTSYGIKDIKNEHNREGEDSIVDIINLLNTQGVFGYIFTKLFKKSIIESSKDPIRFNIDYDFMEDEDFICRYLQRSKKVLYSERIGYHYFLPNAYKYDRYSLERVSLYRKLITEIQKVSKEDFTEAERKYHDSMSVILVGECQRNSFNKESMLSLRKYVIEEFKHCPIILPTKIIVALDPTGFFSALWLRMHLKIKKVDYTHL